MVSIQAILARNPLGAQIKRRPNAIVLAVLLGIIATLSLLRINSFQVGTFKDDAYYIVLAESLSTGQGYRLINFPDAPREWTFPPGWPTLLAPFVAAFPGNYDILKLLALGFWLGSVFLAYRLFKDRIRSPYIQLLIVLVGLNPIMIGMSVMVMSEAAYLFFSLLALHLFQKTEMAERTSVGWIIVAATFAAIIAVQIRAIGLTLILAFLLCLILARRFRDVVIAGAIGLLAIAPQVIFNLRSGGQPISPGYQIQVFSGTIESKLMQGWTNAKDYADGLIAGSILPIFGPRLSRILAVFGAGAALSLINYVVLLLVAVGMLQALRRYRATELYVGLYIMGLLAFWNPNLDRAQARFLIPIIPFLYFYAIKAVEWLGRVIPMESRIIKPALGLALAFVVVLVAIARNIQDWQNPIRHRITDISAGYLWVQDNAPPHSVVMARYPVPNYLYTRRPTVSYPDIGQGIEWYMKALDVDYIVISPKLQSSASLELDEYTRKHLVPFLELSPEDFQLVHKDLDHNATVYKVLD